MALIMLISIKAPGFIRNGFKAVGKSVVVSVVGLFVFALLIRLWGVWHGLPYIYSVDEPALVRAVLGLRFDPNPHHFDWPHWHFYFSFLFFGLFYKARIAWQVWGWRPIMEAAAPILWNDGAIFYLLLRLLSVLMGALTVIPLYLAGKIVLGTNKKAFLAAMLFSVTPFLVENSKYALIDVPATFWVAWSLWFAVRVFKSPSLKNYLLAGFLGGLATSTKYNAVLLLGLLFLIHLGRLPLKESLGLLKSLKIRSLLKTLGAGWWKLGLAALVSVTAFFLGTPYALLDWKTFTNAESSTGALWQVARGGNRFEPAVFGRLLDSLVNTIPGGFGYPAFLVAIVGLVVALKSKNSLQRILAYFALVFYLYVGSSAFAPQQIFMPLFLPLSLLFVIGVVFLVGLIRRELVDTPLAWRVIYPLCVVALIFPSLTASLKVNYLYTNKDTRNIVKEFIDHAVPKGAVIGLEGEYQPYYEGTHPIIGVPAWRWEPLSEKRIEYVVVSGESSLAAIKDNFKYGSVLDKTLPVYMVQNFGDRMGPNLYVYKLDYPEQNKWWLDETKIPPLTLANIFSADHTWRKNYVPTSYLTDLVVTGSWDFTGRISQVMQEKDDYTHPLEGINGHLKSADITFINLNTPLLADCQNFSVCTKDNSHNAFLTAGVDLVSLPSLGSDYAETTRILEADKISYVTADKSAEIISHDTKFSFLNFNSSTTADRVATAVGELRQANKSNVILTNFDWGSTRPSVDLAHAAVDSGADVVLGNSNLVNKVELYKSKFISYGNGPFLTDQTWGVQQGAIAHYFFFNNRLVDIEYEPITTGKYNRLTGWSFQPQVIPDWKTCRDALDAILAASL
jgi:hypothetical protein